MQLQESGDIDPAVTSWVSKAKAALSRSDTAQYQHLLGEGIAVIMSLLDDLAKAKSKAGSQD